MYVYWRLLFGGHPLLPWGSWDKAMENNGMLACDGMQVIMSWVLSLMMVLAVFRLPSPPQWHIVCYTETLKRNRQKGRMFFLHLQVWKWACASLRYVHISAEFPRQCNVSYYTHTLQVSADSYQVNCIIWQCSDVENRLFSPTAFNHFHSNHCSCLFNQFSMTFLI